MCEDCRHLDTGVCVVVFGHREFQVGWLTERQRAWIDKSGWDVLRMPADRSPRYPPFFEERNGWKMVMKFAPRCSLTGVGTARLPSCFT